MKFSFEKIKSNLAKKITQGTVVAGLVSAPLSSSGSDRIENKKIDIDLPHNTIELSQENKINKIDSKENIHFSVVKQSLENTEKIDYNDEDRKYYEKIRDMELLLSKYSKEGSKIEEGTISFLSNYELEGKVDDRKFTELDGVERTSQLENRYIKNSVLVNFINDKDNFRILDKNPLSGSSIVEGLKLIEEGYVNAPDKGFKHLIPEYYFILDQEDDGSVIAFSLKIFSTKDKKIILEKNINYNIPENSSKISYFAENEVIPGITQNLKEMYYSIKK